MTLPVETLKSVPPGKAVWNANGGFVSVLLTHLVFFNFITSKIHYGGRELGSSCRCPAVGYVAFNSVSVCVTRYMHPILLNIKWHQFVSNAERSETVI